MTEVEEGRRHGRRGALAAPCHIWSHFLVFYYPLLVVIYLILLNKNDLHEILGWRMVEHLGRQHYGVLGS